MMRKNKNGDLTWVHWLVIFSSLLITLFAWDYSRTQQNEKLKQSFDFQSDQLIALVTERMSHYEDALRSGVAAFHSQNNSMNHSDWKKFSTALKLEDRYRGIAGIGVILYLTSSTKNKYIVNERKTRPNFNIHPEHKKTEYWPIIYVEPEEFNKKAIGLDMAFEKNRLSAAKKSRNTGVPQITAPITLVQDSKKTPGFLQFVPFYSKVNLKTNQEREQNFIGHVYAPFIMERLIEGTLEQKNRKLSFSIFDGEDKLYDEMKLIEEDYDQNPIFTKVIEIDVYGRPWTFNIQTGASFRETTSSNQSLLILVGGILIDSMLLILFFILSRSNRNAIELASEMTNKLSSSEEYNRHVIESAPCGIMIVDVDGKIERANSRICKLFSYETDEIIGSPVENLIPHDMRVVHVDKRTLSFENSKKRIMANRDVLALSKNGHEFPVEIGLAPFEIDGENKMIATIVDMTEHSNVVSELTRSNKELDDFAYVASHDLKAPLRGIIQLSNWIKEDIENIATDDTKSNLTLLRNRTVRLEKLLDDLLSYSRIGRNTGSQVDLDVSELINNTFLLLDPPKNIKLVINGELPIFETLNVPLELIFRNLIGNAIKHNDNLNGLIEISAVENEDNYEFTVADDGPGIDPKLHGQVFELFKTLKPRDEVEGSGMGLSIIKKILTYYGQEIDLVSDGIKGSKFIFKWPKNIIKDDFNE